MVYHLAKTHSLVNSWISELRSIASQTDRMRFRRNIERIGEVMAYEISKTMPYNAVDMQTPLGIYRGVAMAHQPVIATIFRAGFPLFQGLLHYFDQADGAFIASYRKHDADGGFHIQQEYVTCPDLSGRTLIVADPMLATGSSIILALEELEKYGRHAALHIAVVIAYSEAVEKIEKKFPQAQIWTADIDNELDGKGYIIPGLGDAGDLAFGGKVKG